MSKIKMVTIVGTRPELIKLSRVIPTLDLHTHHIFVHTGQNFDHELNQIFFQELSVREPDYRLDVGGEGVAQAISKTIVGCDEIFAKELPDAVLVLGDTNSCLSVIPAKRRKIPIFHMEAGNRCFDQRVPEEINRKIVDHLSDINLPYTEHARRYLLQEGLPPETVIKTGSPMGEVLQHYMLQIQASRILDNLQLAQKEYFLVSIHREENVDNPKNFQRIVDTLNAIATRYQKKIVFSAHPRTREKLEALPSSRFNGLISFIKPVGFFGYIKLQMNSFCVLSDSGTLSEESSILGFPGIMLREAHERPEGMDEATVIMSGLSTERVIQSIDVTVAQYAASPRPFNLVSDYSSENVSSKVLRVILSYTDYVNRTVWHK